MRYCPRPSLTAVRTRSMRAGLAASTVAPGSTAPEESRTVPANVAWPWASDGTTAHATTTNVRAISRVMGQAPFEMEVRP